MESYTEMKDNFIQSAAAVPEEKYGFKLTPGQFSFAGWLTHSVGAIYFYCYRFGGVPAPPRERLSRMKSLTAKSDLEQLVKDSFEYCDTALKGMNDERALAPFSLNGKEVVPVTHMIGMVTGLNEHYGNIVGYLRTLGITPPSTLREQAQKK